MKPPPQGLTCFLWFVFGYTLNGSMESVMHIAKMLGLLVVLLTICFSGVRAEETKYPVVPVQFRGIWKDEGGEIFEIVYNEPRHLSYVVTKNNACQFLNEVPVEEKKSGQVVYNAGCFEVGHVKKVQQLQITMEMSDDTLTMSLWLGQELHTIFLVAS